MKSESEFINYHLNRIRKIQTSMNNKRIFVECFPTDDNAICFPNSNLAVKEIFFDESESPSSSSEEEAIWERKFTLKEALEIITSAMAEDKSEGSYYYSWQANIAMAFKDEFDRQHAARKDFTRWLFIENGLHEIANNAAKNFLNILTLNNQRNDTHRTKNTAFGRRR